MENAVEPKAVSEGSRIGPPLRNPGSLRRPIGVLLISVYLFLHYGIRAYFAHSGPNRRGRARSGPEVLLRECDPD
jgi:hypothetical protein